jgi:hypothetical protein
VNDEERIALETNKAIMSLLASNPTRRLLDLDSITEEEIKGYLQSKHATLWGGSFTVSSTDSLNKAINFFSKELDGLYEFVTRVRSLTTTS